MWIASKYGWFSIVKEGVALHVRARSKKGMEELCIQIYKNTGISVAISKWRMADHRFRFVTRDRQVARSVFMIFANSIDYPNFKNEDRSKS
jgi:hypothetical protein